MDNKTAKFKSTFIKRVDDEHVLKKNYSHELTGLLPSIHKPRSINSPLCKHITSASILIQIFKAKQSTHNRMHQEQSCFSPFATVPANHLECQAHFQKKFPTIDRIKPLSTFDSLYPQSWDLSQESMEVLPETVAIWLVKWRRELVRVC